MWLYIIYRTAWEWWVNTSTTERAHTVYTVLQNDEQFEGTKERSVDVLVRRLTLHPASISSLMTSECPASTAKCRGVTEARCPAVIVASTNAPAANSRPTTPTWPVCAATCRALTSLATWPPPPRMRSVARLVTSHPALISSSTTWQCCCCTARKTGVTDPLPGRSTWQRPDSSSNLVTSTWPFHAEICSADQPLTCISQRTTVSNDPAYTHSAHWQTEGIYCDIGSRREADNGHGLPSEWSRNQC